jgi:hypothetical protein
MPPAVKLHEEYWQANIIDNSNKLKYCAILHAGDSQL